MQACSKARCDMKLSLQVSYVQKIDRLDGDPKGNETNVSVLVGGGVLIREDWRGASVGEQAKVPSCRCRSSIRLVSHQT
jgi:hypothetical protein